MRIFRPRSGISERSLTLRRRGGLKTSTDETELGQ
jgi:hypothetical protein